VLLAVVALAAGCGAHHNSIQTLNKRTDCLLTAEHKAELKVMRAAIANGKIARAQIVSHFHRSLPQRTYLGADGNLLPYDQLAAHPKAMLDWDEWRYELESSKLLGRQLHAAVARTADAVKPHCESLE
jgi:hypothetical protein